MREPAELNPELYRLAARQTAAGSKSFYFATRFFPADVARAAHSVYWFCRHTDDIVDETACPRAAERELDAWEAALERGLSGEAVEHPALRVFLQTVRRHGIPHRYPRELIAGMRMDLAGTRYRDFAELRVFCYRVASVVGLMMMHVIGFRGDAEVYAIDLGIAMQLTNILRDVGEDWRRGRLYLPAEELREFAYTEEDLAAGRVDGRFRKLMRFQMERARRYYEQAAPGIPLLDTRGRFAVQVAADVYRQILDRIEQCGFDVFQHRAVVPARQKYWLTARAMAGPVARYSVERMLFWRTQA